MDGNTLDLRNTIEYIEESSADQSNTKMQITLLSLICLGLYCLLRRKINWKEIIKSNLWLIIFLLYITLSISWSDYQLISFKRYIKTFGIIVMVLVIYSEDFPQLALSYILKRVFIFDLLISAVLIFLIPELGVRISSGDPQWVGLTFTKNNLGQVACLAGIYFFWVLTKQEVNQKSITNVCLFILSIFLLLGSQSMTSIIVFAMAFFLFSFFQVNVPPRFTIIIYLYSIILAGLSIALLNQIVFQGELIKSIFDAAGKDLTFTGRAGLWKDVLSLASHNLFLGVGYGSFWLDNLGNSLWDIYIWRPNQAHNGYIDVIASVGILGLALLICTIRAGFVSISSQFNKNYDFAKIRMVLLVVVLIFNLTESSLCRDNNFLWFIYLLVIFNMNYDIVQDNQQRYLPQSKTNNSTAQK